MSRPPDYMYRVSEALAEVMDDIGVNERLVKKRRRTYLLKECIMTWLMLHVGPKAVYNFGSQIEGSTTLGLRSDVDDLTIFHGNLIQCISEWEHRVKNFMMIQNENIFPGYCHLQCIRPDVPLPATDTPFEFWNHCTTDKRGRIMLKNTQITSCFHFPFPTSDQLHGPALATPEEYGFPSVDKVYGYYCKSLPHQAKSWLQKQKEGKWPSDDVIADCGNAGCFVVPVGSKVHSPDILESELEWRISTSLQERYLMFSLNIPQLMCYILMKMILKTHINPYVEDVLSSFMCKNVLLYCISNSSHDWHTGKLLSYLHKCLFMLKECVKQRNCPHFIITENNLLAGHMTDTQRGKLLEIVNNLLKSAGQFIFEIQFDDIDRRVMMKLNMIPYSSKIQSAAGISQDISGALVSAIAETQSCYLRIIQIKINCKSLQIVQEYLSQTFSKMEKYRREGNLKQRVASELLKPLVSSTLGSVLACIQIDTRTTISDQAFTYLEAGKESDALSGRLKLVSVLYCTGDIVRAEDELRTIKTKYNILEIQTECVCYEVANLCKKLNFLNACIDVNEEVIKSHVAVCTTFMQCEINCVPHELRYELFRSYCVDRQIRRLGEYWWTIFIVVDSIPYLRFLQYKTYKHLQRREEQVQALADLVLSIYCELGLGHKETALNLLGQCFEQENCQALALQCYIDSLRHRVRNNAARLLLCLQLFKLWKQ